MFGGWEGRVGMELQIRSRKVGLGEGGLIGIAGFYAVGLSFGVSS